MDIKTNERFKKWKEFEGLIDELADDLKSAFANEDDINDRFYKELEFGTAGLRGVMGAGTNRMNTYTVGRATIGYAKYLLKKNDKPSMAIAYDSRNRSKEFAELTAGIMAHYGVKVYLWPELMPTPALSFAVRYFGCDGGVVITASHNPAEYNGYKAYGSDGAQLGQEEADDVFTKIMAEDIFAAGAFVNGYKKGIEDGTIELISKEVYDAFIDACSATSLADDSIDRSAKIAYTPLYGTGLKPVTDCLKKNGFTNVMVVDEQAKPNGNFPTCPYPNPESREAMEVGLTFAKENDADILIATDPDADRIGIAVKDGDDFKLFTGNEVGILLLDYICTMREKRSMMPKNPVAVKTIVSSDLASKVALKHGVEMRDTLTGFKNIGAIVTELSDAGEVERYLIGFEESYGYMLGDHVRDKDAVSAALGIAEMFAYLKSIGKSIPQRMGEIYKEFGYYLNTTISYQFPGESGFAKMAEIMKYFRENPKESIAGYKVNTIEDYTNGLRGLPKSDVLKYLMEGYNMAVLRPSGTEPKLKLYIGVSASDAAEAKAIADKIKADFEVNLK